jgi:hypothetical protein
MIDYYHCPWGLGNRISMLANAIANNAPFYWKRTKHWNYTPSQTFSVVPPNVVVREPKGTKIVGEGVNNRYLVAGMDSIFDTLLESLRGEKDASTYAVHYRFLSYGRIVTKDAYKCVIKTVAELNVRGIKEVSVFSDSNRLLVYDLIRMAGIRVIKQKAKPLTHDLDRATDLVEMLSDYYALNQAKTIFANYDRSSMTYPAVQKGAELVHCL